jgi:histidine triad (HIT) family protein
MPTLFTRIIEGELPGIFVWRDELAVAFLSIAPASPGHTLVVPIEPVDHWIDLAPDLAAHLMVVSQWIGRAQQAAFGRQRVGLIVAGLEVPHTHVHVIPMDDMEDLHLPPPPPTPDIAAMSKTATQIREALRAIGAPSVAD